MGWSEEDEIREQAIRSRIRGAVEVLKDAAENVLINYYLDWNMDGVIEALRLALNEVDEGKGS